MRRFGLKALTAFVLVFSIVFSNIALARSVTASVYDIDIEVQYHQTEAREMFDRINDFRSKDQYCWAENNVDKKLYPVAEHGSLVYDYTLEKIAMQRAADIVFLFDHKRPDGSEIFTITVDGVHTSGENLAYGYGNEEAAFIGLREDDEKYAGQGHRRNMLNSSFTKVGIACVEYNGIKYWVQEFGTSDTLGSLDFTTANDSVCTVNVPVSDAYVPEHFGMVSMYSGVTDFAAVGEKHKIAFFESVRVGIIRGNYLVEDYSDSCEVVWHMKDEAGNSYDEYITGTLDTVTITRAGSYILSADISYQGYSCQSFVEVEMAVHPLAGYDFEYIYEVDHEYTGKPITPALTIKLWGNELVQDQDYTVIYYNNREVREKTNQYAPFIHVEGKGEYSTLKKDIVFNINPRDISKANVSFAESSFVYSGEKYEPVPVVKVGIDTLVNDVDYTYTYEDNLDAGEAKILITGIGNNTGTKEATFTISPRSISSAEVRWSEEFYDYNSDNRPVPSVTVADTELVYEKDFEVDYPETPSVGANSVTIRGINNYFGSLNKTYYISDNDISEAVVTGIDDEYEYIGEAIIPDVTVTLNGVPLKKNVDYTVSVSDSNTVGTASLTITGAGKYTGKIVNTFEVTSAQINSDMVTSNNAVQFTGTAVKPDVTITAFGKTLVEDEDYKLTYSGVDVGSAQATVIGIGNFKGEFNFDYQICVGNLSTAEVTVVPESSVYTGSRIPVSVSVMLDGVELIKDTDYTVTVSNDVNVGEAKVLISGINNYSGSIEKTFDITCASIEDVTIDGIPSSVVYSGNAYEFNPVVIFNDKALVINEDYAVTYINNDCVGECSTVITGINNFEGELVITTLITPKNIENAEIIGIGDVEYTGNVASHNSTVKIGDITLVEGSDYELVYNDDYSLGTTYVEVVGINNYEGSVKVEYNIIRAILVVDDVSSIEASYAYTGSEICPLPTVMHNGNTLIQGTDYEVAYDKNTEIGEASLTITGKDNYIGTFEIPFTICEASIGNASVSLDKESYLYTGEEIVPEVVVTLGDKVLEEGRDYEISMGDNINAGNVELCILGKNNYTGEIKTTFVIAKISLANAKVSDVPSEVFYNPYGYTFTPVVKIGGIVIPSTEYTVSYSVSNGNGTVIINGVNNYKGSISQKFVVNPLDISDSNVKFTVSGIGDVLYTGNQPVFNPTFKVNGITLNEKNYKLTYNNSYSVGESYVIIEGVNNYTGSRKIEFKINPCPLVQQGAQISLSSTKLIYNGSAITPDVTVTCNGVALNKSEYTVTFSNNVNVGNATVKVTGVGGYTGSVYSTFTIDKADISSAYVLGLPESVTYNGSQFCPTPRVVIGLDRLVENSDYVVSYSNNSNVGTATVIVTGIGNYQGRATGTFVIKAAPVVTPSPTPSPTPAPKDDNSVEGFCERLYTCALNRGSDAGGIKTWSGVLTDGSMNGAEVAYGFFFSDEITKYHPVSDEEFIRRLYATFMNRVPDAGGYSTWLNYMKEGHSREDVFQGFVNSQEWANVCFRYGIESGGATAPNITLTPSQNVIDFATRLYTTCLGRSPDSTGVNNWSSWLANRQFTGTEAAYGFFFSGEFISHNYKNSEYVDRLYRTFMGRESDEDGKRLWVGLLERGEWNREQVFYGFANSAEFGKICSGYGIRR